MALPRDLGELNGEKVIVTTGRFGPYMKVGKTNVSLPESYDPYTVELAEVKEIIAGEKERKKQALKPLKELGDNIVVKTGRFGPYVTDGKTNVSLGRKLTVEDITLELAKEMLEKKAKSKGRKKK